MRFYWIQEESSGVLEFDENSGYPAGSAEESQSSANFNEKLRILQAEYGRVGLPDLLKYSFFTQQHLFLVLAPSFRNWTLIFKAKVMIFHLGLARL